MNPHRVIAADCVLGEGPLWDPQHQQLVWIDGNTPHLWRWRWGEATAQSWPLARPPAALARLDDGRLFIAFRARFGVMAEAGAPIDDFELPHGWDLGEERFNDAKVDSAGRLWIGTIDRKLHRPIGHLYRVDERGAVAVAGGFALSNGMGWSPDGRSLFFAESFDRLIHRFEFDPATGQASPGGPLANLAGGAPKPDGITVDREGGIWCAIFGGGCVNRYLPDGRLDRSLQLPVSQPTSCMFGGPDLSTLFVTTAKYGLSDAERAAQPLAGSLFAFDLEVQGCPEPLLNARFVLPGEFHE